jgi:hypothetical protein
MTADEAWENILYSHRQYHSFLKDYGYQYELIVQSFPELSEMQKINNPLREQLAKYRDIFINQIYDKKTLQQYDDVLKNTAIPMLEKARQILAPMVKKWGVQFPDSLAILTSYGRGGSYWFGDNPKILIKITDYSPDQIPYTLIHEFVHILIEIPIIEKYNVPQDLKERIVDIICLEYFNKPPQKKFENSFANKYITKEAIENDLPGAVKTMMKDYNGFRMIRQELAQKSQG